MVGEIFIDGIRMEDGDREILEGCKTYEERKEFWLVYYKMKHIRGDDGRKAYEEGYANTNTNDNLELEKEGEFIENNHNELVGDCRVDVDDEIQDEPMEVEKSIGEEKKIHKNDKKGTVLWRKKIHRNKKGGSAL